MVINILDLAPVKVSVNPADYSSFIYGVPKIGKTTLAYELYGERGLFLATEDRHKSLGGAKVQRITSWVEYLTVMNQLRQPGAKEMYDVVILDTVENLYNMLEKYIAAKYKEKAVGERDDLWGKDWTDLKRSWKDGLNMISEAGFVPCFIAHATENTVQIPASGVLQSDLEGVTAELKTIKDKNDKNKTLDVYEFNKYMPDLKDKVFAPINRMVDNILFCNTTLDISTGEEKRVIYLRDTLQWMAGSTFTDIEPIVPLSATEYIKAVENALGKVSKKQTRKSIKYEAKKELDFNELMEKVKAAGKAFHENGKLDILTAISANVFGTGNKVTDATEDQVELLAQAWSLIEQKAKTEKIEIKL